MAECGCANYETYAANFPQMRKVDGYEAKVYLGLFKRMSETTGTETWQQVLVKMCLYCPCPPGTPCDASGCCFLPCATEVYDTLISTNTPVVNFPNLPPFPVPWPPGDPLQWLQMIEPKSLTRPAVTAGADAGGM